MGGTISDDQKGRIFYRWELDWYWEREIGIDAVPMRRHKVLTSAGMSAPIYGRRARSFPSQLQLPQFPVPAPHMGDDLEWKASVKTSLSSG